ncbi:MAG: hypothetical protein Q4F81_06225 [Eubacteriales bacterium]|nr:hypothetical protein [Eubacteriales bacterium]
MSGFNRFYLWGVKMKYHMCIYTVSGLFFKAIANALQGVYTVDSLTMLEMLVVSMIFASIETAIFPEAHPFGESKGRVFLWAVLANVAFLGGALGFGWFRGIPVWAGVVLVLILEGAMAAMWYAMRLEKKQDTKALNQNLRKFQGE